MRERARAPQSNECRRPTRAPKPDIVAAAARLANQKHQRRPDKTATATATATPATGNQRSQSPITCAQMVAPIDGRRLEREAVECRLGPWLAQRRHQDAAGPSQVASACARPKWREDSTSKWAIPLHRSTKKKRRRPQSSISAQSMASGLGARGSPASALVWLLLAWAPLAGALQQPGADGPGPAAWPGQPEAANLPPGEF